MNYYPPLSSMTCFSSHKTMHPFIQLSNFTSQTISPLVPTLATICADFLFTKPLCMYLPIYLAVIDKLKHCSIFTALHSSISGPSHLLVASLLPPLPFFCIFLENRHSLAQLPPPPPIT